MTVWVTGSDGGGDRNDRGEPADRELGVNEVVRSNGHDRPGGETGRHAWDGARLHLERPMRDCCTGLSCRPDRCHLRGWRRLWPRAGRQRWTSCASWAWPGRRRGVWWRCHARQVIDTLLSEQATLLQRALDEVLSRQRRIPAPCWRRGRNWTVTMTVTVGNESRRFP